MNEKVKGINGEETRWESLVGAVNSFINFRLKNKANDIITIIEFNGR
jgi:hypothetical protein